MVRDPFPRYSTLADENVIKIPVGIVGRIALIGAVMSTRPSPPSSAARGVTALPDTSSARVILLGTGTPIPDPERSGPATAVVVNGASYIVDAGPGVVRRATAAALRDSIVALRAPNLRYLFLTHLHSDHTLGLPDIMLTPAVMHRKGPLYVYGPPGTRAKVANILAAYREDIKLRVHALERGDPNSYRIVARDVTPGVVYRDSNVTVRAFRVPHGSWKSAFGYRFDTPRRSIVISGDTGPGARGAGRAEQRGFYARRASRILRAGDGYSKRSMISNTTHFPLHTFH